jgi:ADP-heptose:LPS heptosyltransferase
MYILYAPPEKFGYINNVAPICESVKFFHNTALCPAQYWQKIHTLQGFKDITPKNFKKIRAGRVLKNILFICKGGIGDCMWPMPAIKAVRTKYPKAIIGIIAEKKAAAVFQHFPYANFCTPDELWNISNLLRTSQEIYDFGGIATVNKKHMNMDPIDACLDIVGAPKPKTKKDGRPHLVVTADEGKKAEAFLRRNGIEPYTKPLITIFTESSTPNRNWPFTYTQELTDKLIEAGNQVIWLSEKDDIKTNTSALCNTCGYEIVASTREDIKELKATCPACGNITTLKHQNRQNFANLAKETSIRQTMAIVALSDLVITPVTAPIIIATSFQIPTIGLLGPFPTKHFSKYYDHFLPLEGAYSCKHCEQHWTECPEGHPSPCMRSLSVEKVFAGAIKMLKTYPPALRNKKPII